MNPNLSPDHMLFPLCPFISWELPQAMTDCGGGHAGPPAGQRGAANCRLREGRKKGRKEGKSPYLPWSAKRRRGRGYPLKRDFRGNTAEMDGPQAGGLGGTHQQPTLS